jgi:hypothetical protein
MFALAHLTDIPGRLSLVHVSANKISAWSVTEACFTREGGMRNRLRSITRGGARGAASYVSANNSALYAGSWNARTLTGRPTWSASRKRRGWRAPIPAWPPVTSWTRAPPPGCTRSCGPAMDCSPAVRSRRFLQRGILVPRDWPHLPWSGLLSAVRGVRPGGKPISISANEHLLTPNDRTISWLLGLAKLGLVSR